MITLSLGVCGDGYKPRCARAAACVIRGPSIRVEKARVVSRDPVTTPRAWVLAVAGALRSARALRATTPVSCEIRIRDVSLVRALAARTGYGDNEDLLPGIWADMDEIAVQVVWIAKASNDVDMNLAAALAEACFRREIVG